MELFISPSKFYLLFFHDHKSALRLLKRGVNDVTNGNVTSYKFPTTKKDVLNTPVHVGELLDFLWPSQMRLLDIVCTNGDTYSLRKLLNLGSDPNFGNGNPNHFVIMHNDKLSPFGCNILAPTILYAIINHQVECVKILLEEGALIYNAPKEKHDKKTLKKECMVCPILHVAKEGNPWVMSVIVDHIKKHPDVLTPSKHLRRVLMEAVKRMLKIMKNESHNLEKIDDYVVCLQLFVECITFQDRFGLSYKLCRGYILARARDIRVLKILIENSGRPRSWFSRNCEFHHIRYKSTCCVAHDFIARGVDVSCIKYLLSKGIKLDCDYTTDHCMANLMRNCISDSKSHSFHGSNEADFKNAMKCLHLLNKNMHCVHYSHFSQHMSRSIIDYFFREKFVYSRIKEFLIALFIYRLAPVPYIKKNATEIIVYWDPAPPFAYGPPSVDDGLDLFISIVRSYYDMTLFDKLFYILQNS